MDRKTIQSILHDAMEREIPSSQIDLLPNVKESLVAGANQQGDKMNTTNSRHMSRIALAALAVGAILVVALVTPQGRAFAQNILQLFTRADQDRYPLQPWQMTPPAQTSSESPFKFSIQVVESLAKDDILSPVEIPAGMSFVGASYDEQTHMVAQAFGQDGEYIQLSLWQQPLEYYQPCGDISDYCDNMLGWNLVGASADLQQVQIGDLTGEYVEGTWNLTANGPVWEPTPFVKILRWQTDDRILQLVSGIELTRDDLLKVAVGIR